MAMGVCGYIEVDGVKYWKPNMAALEGELGRSIMQHVRNTPRVDYDKLDAEIGEIEARMRKAKEDGTF